MPGRIHVNLREVLARPGAGGELQVHGSGALFRWLLDNDLVDEINLFTFPVVVGQGTRLFPETGPDIALELVGSQVVTPSGVTIQVSRERLRPPVQLADPTPRVEVGAGLTCLECPILADRPPEQPGRPTDAEPLTPPVSFEHPGE